MTVLSIYIFRTDGIPLFSRYYDTDPTAIDGLVTPFLMSTRNRMQEITDGGEIDNISLGNDKYLCMEEFGEIIFAVVYQGKESIAMEVNLLARKFYKRFHSTVQGKGWKGKLDNFDEFIPDIESMLDINPNIVIIKKPDRPLDTLALVEYNPPIPQIIKYIIKDEQVEISQLEQEMEYSRKELQTFLTSLVDDGYLGIKQKQDDESIYYRMP